MSKSLQSLFSTERRSEEQRERFAYGHLKEKAVKTVQKQRIVQSESLVFESERAKV